MNITDDDLRAALKNLDPAPAPDPQILQNARQRLVLERESPQPPERRRRWVQLAAAACLGAAVVTGVGIVANTYSPGGSDSASVASQESGSAMDGAVAEPSSGAARSTQDPKLARDASAVVAADDVQAARDEFVDTVRSLGGRVTSETTTTTGGQAEPAPDIAVYPPIPTGPGVNLAVEVPADKYDQAVAAIQPLGAVVQFSQSSVDTGTEIADGKARIAALAASVATLQDLLSRAESISDVIALEEAISQRQSELDALSAQQRYLESQVTQARISLELMTPEDAAERYGTTSSWWQQVTNVLAGSWLWLGRVLLWTSPLWLLGLGWWLWRRRA